MHIRLYKRHGKGCEHKDDEKYMRCPCSVWLAWGKTRKSAGTPIRDRAQDKADAIKKQFEDAEFGIAKPQASTAALVEDAVKKFLDDKRGQNLDDETISKHRKTTSRLLDFCRRKGILFMHEITLPHLTEHRVEWNKYYNRPLCKRTNQERLRSFFRYCEDAGWIETNPAAKLSSIKIKKDEQVATQPFEPDEMVRILAAIPECNFTANCARRVRTLILIQRYAGLAIQDAIKLARTQVCESGRDYRVIMKRTKTGVGINNVIPGWVGEEILTTPNQNPKYFLWSGKGKPKSAVAYFQRLLKKVFSVAGRMEAVAGPLHGGLVQVYPDGETGIGWHRDKGRPEIIASLSLGAEREFAFGEGPVKHCVEVGRIRFAHGSLLLIPASVNQALKHRLPPAKRVKEPRINVTLKYHSTWMASSALWTNARYSWL